MIKKLTLLLLILIIVSFADGCNTEGALKNRMRKKDHLIVAMDISTPGLVSHAGELYGYHYDILRAYAERFELGLRVVTGNSIQSCMELVESGYADIAIVAKAAGGEVGRGEEVALYETSYAVLTKKRGKKNVKQKKNKLNEEAVALKVLIPEVFRDIVSVEGNVIKGLPEEVEIEQTWLGDLSMLDELNQGRCDYALCEKSEAQLGMKMLGNLVVAGDNAGRLTIAAFVGGHIEGLRSDFARWAEGYKNSDEGLALRRVYFEKGSMAQLHEIRCDMAGREAISMYDRVLKRVGSQADMDWRFLSAIAYAESRFNAFVTSPKGALGLMQVMPFVARHFECDPQELTDPEINASLAVRLIRDIESTLRLPEGVSQEDRMQFVLAAYNGGVGHVLDAIRLTKKYGGDVASWDDVASYLKKKSQAKYRYDPVVKHGYFKSGQTAAFIDTVMGKYQQYCLLHAR